MCTTAVHSFIRPLRIRRLFLIYFPVSFFFLHNHKASSSFHRDKSVDTPIISTPTTAVVQENTLFFFFLLGCDPSHWLFVPLQNTHHDLYWTTGDGGPQTDDLNTGQDTANMMGSMMRISVPSDGTGYEIPSGNLECEQIRAKYLYTDPPKQG